MSYRMHIKRYATGEGLNVAFCGAKQQRTNDVRGVSFTPNHDLATCSRCKSMYNRMHGVLIDHFEDEIMPTIVEIYEAEKGGKK